MVLLESRGDEEKRQQNTQSSDLTSTLQSHQQTQKSNAAVPERLLLLPEEISRLRR
ncbi:hypothetical protein [Nostoc sp. CCY 9925]|uniref:hypothetical protein n=1 Tax=Nostoc sp. CCY 9925 TaxID=3103865 RepID=UPI0039C61F01